MAGGTVDFGPPPKPQGVDFGPPPTHAQAVDFGPPPSKPRPITDIPVLGPRYVGPGATFRPDALAPYKPPVPQSSVRAASSLDAANQIPAAPTSADKLLGGDSGYPLVDLASNELFNRDKSRLSQAANLLPPVFLARQGAQAGQELGRGQYGQGLARLGVNAAMGLAGDAIAARARPMGFGTFTGAGAERLPAPAFEQNPTLPEALSPAVNETPRPSAAAAQVRSALIAPKPVAAPRPAEPTESFMNWSGAAEDQALSPEARPYARVRPGPQRMRPMQRVRPCHFRVRQADRRLIQRRRSSHRPRASHSRTSRWFRLSGHQNKPLRLLRLRMSLPLTTIPLTCLANLTTFWREC